MRLAPSISLDAIVVNIWSRSRPNQTRPARFGKAFNSGQVLDHVAKAVLKALRVASSHGAKVDRRAGSCFRGTRCIRQVLWGVRHATGRSRLTNPRFSLVRRGSYGRAARPP